jgi:hypothetical protein
MIKTRTNAHQVYCKHACLMTELSSRSGDLIRSTSVTVVGLENYLGKVDELLGEISKEKGHERLEGQL